MCSAKKLALSKMNADEKNIEITDLFEKGLLSVMFISVKYFLRIYRFW